MPIPPEDPSRYCTEEEITRADCAVLVYVDFYDSLGNPTFKDFLNFVYQLEFGQSSNISDSTLRDSLIAHFLDSCGGGCTALELIEWLAGIQGWYGLGTTDGSPVYINLTQTLYDDYEGEVQYPDDAGNVWGNYDYQLSSGIFNGIINGTIDHIACERVIEFRGSIEVEGGWMYREWKEYVFGVFKNSPGQTTIPTFYSEDDNVERPAWATQIFDTPLQNNQIVRFSTLDCSVPENEIINGGN